MTERNDGGPAFPTEHWAIGTERNPFTPSSGMSLRDWFAGQALAALFTRDRASALNSEIVREAYVLADFMLTERGK